MTQTGPRPIGAANAGRLCRPAAVCRPPRSGGRRRARVGAVGVTLALAWALLKLLLFATRKPTSGSLGWAAGDEAGVVSHGIVVEDAGYFDLCRSYFFWEQSKGGFLNDTVGASELGSFTPRAVVSVPMCWDAAPTRGLATMGDGAGGELVEGGS